MEILTTIVSFSLLLGIIVSPILVLFRLRKFNLKSNFIVYLVIGITITSILTLLFAWWSDASNHMLLSHYGYDFEAMNDTERFANVSAQNLERVKRLEASMMGIGWPLKAFMTYVVYAPYLLIVYLITYLLKKYKKNIHLTPHNSATRVQTHKATT
jgi:hypothetical protein